MQILQVWDRTDSHDQVFDLSGWHAATSLYDFGVELNLRRGFARVHLRHYKDNGQSNIIADLSPPEDGLPGSTYTPPLIVSEHIGFIRAELIEQSEDADYDLRFISGAPMLRQHPRLCVITLLEADRLEICHYDAQGNLRQESRLDVPKGCGFGAGVWHVAFGPGMDAGSDHIFLKTANVDLGSTEIIRLLAVLRYLRPGVHLAASGITEGANSWICFSIADLAICGLPWPGLDRDPAIISRQIATALGPAVTLESLPVSIPKKLDEQGLNNNYLAMLLFKLHEEGAAALAWYHAAEVSGDLRRGETDRAARSLKVMQALLDGATTTFEALTTPSVVNTEWRWPLARWRLYRCLRRQMARLAAAGQGLTVELGRLSGPLFWAEHCKGWASADMPTADRVLMGLQRQIALAVNQTAQNLATEARAREQMLRMRGLDNPERVRADLERANLLALSALRNVHAGRRCIIVGNGPSLAISDLDRLHDVISFGSNKIYLAYGQTSWRPTYYSVEDHLVLHNCRDEILGLQNSFKIFPAQIRDFGYDAADTLFVPQRRPVSYSDPLSDPNFPGFSTDLTHGIFWGSSVIYSQIQMAVHMGFTEIVLIGVDHSYELPDLKLGRVYVHSGERNHFHPDYRRPGELWHQPNLDVLEVSYTRAKEICSARGITIWNASRYSALAVFERVSFDALFPPGKKTKESQRGRTTTGS